MKMTNMEKDTELSEEEMTLVLRNMCAAIREIREAGWRAERRERIKDAFKIAAVPLGLAAGWLLFLLFAGQL